MQPQSDAALYQSIKNAASQLGVSDKILGKLDGIGVQSTAGQSYYDFATHTAFISTSADTPRDLLKTFVHEYEHSEQQWMNDLGRYYLEQGDFDQFVYYNTLREAYSAAAEIMLFGNVQSDDWFGYVTVAQAQTALSTVTAYGPQSETSLKTNLATALYDSFKSNPIYGNYETTLSQDFMSYWRDGFLNSDNLTPRQSDLLSSNTRAIDGNGIEIFGANQSGDLSLIRRYFTDSSKTTVEFEVFLDRTTDGRSFQSIINYNPDSGVPQCQLITREIDESATGQEPLSPAAWSTDELAILASLPMEYRVSSGYEIPLGDPFVGVDDYSTAPPDPYQERMVQAMTIDFFNQYTDSTHMHAVDRDNPERAFNWDGTGGWNPTAWLGVGEAFLVDAEATHSGTVTPDDVVYNLYQLTLKDSNHDGKFNSSDAAWSDYGVWFGDMRWDPSAQAMRSSILSLDQMGISSIDLTGTSASPRDAWGNLWDSTVAFTNGSSAVIRTSSFTYIQGPGY